MNKSQLVDAIAMETGISKTDARKCVDAFISVTAEALRQGERVTLAGFGSFIMTRKAARIGRNPRTGMQIRIAPRKVVRFRSAMDANAEPEI